MNVGRVVTPTARAVPHTIPTVSRTERANRQVATKRIATVVLTQKTIRHHAFRLEPFLAVFGYSRYSRHPFGSFHHHHHHGE